MNEPLNIEVEVKGKDWTPEARGTSEATWRRGYLIGRRTRIRDGSRYNARGTY